MRREFIAAGFAVGLCAIPAVAQSFDPDTATRAYLATLNGAARAKSDAYFEGGYWLILWGAVVGILVNWVFLHFGWAGRLSAWTRRKTPSRALQVVLWIVPFALATAVLSFPWTVYTGFFREHQYGLSTQTFGAWFGEQMTGLAIGVLTMAIIVSALMALVRRAGRAWWAWGAAVTIALLTIAILLAPVFIEPLFNKYSPLPEGVVRQQTLSMARANSVPADNVYLVDASRQTTRISANVAGVGPTIRIALNDNLLNKSTPAEVRAVMGHELGHYVLNHIWKMLMSFGLLTLLAFLAIDRFVPRLIARYGQRWGIASFDDPATVAVASIVLSVFFFLATPVTNTLIRTQEQEADVFGLNAARAPDGFAKIALKLSTYRKIEPGPWEEAIFFDHPSGRTRIETAMRWKAEHLTEPGVE